MDLIPTYAIWLLYPVGIIFSILISYTVYSWVKYPDGHILDTEEGRQAVQMLGAVEAKRNN